MSFENRYEKFLMVFMVNCFEKFHAKKVGKIPTLSERRLPLREPGI